MTIRRRRDEIVSVESVNPKDTDSADSYFTDIYHHLLTSSWFLLLVQIAAVFFLLNVVFATGYYLDGGVANARPGSFVDVFFFSIETMATIGYGRMVPVTIIAHVLMSFEALTGLLGFALVTGLMFAKFSRPSARVRFSRHAVISKRDGVPSLMFRLANARRNQIVEAQVHVLLARAEKTIEGEDVWRFHDLELSRDRNGTFRHSWTVIHPIRPDSPLYNSSPESVNSALTEIVVSMTGIEGSLMQTVYARHTYAARDIIWGVRLADVLIRTPRGGFVFDYSKFDAVDPAEMPVWGLRQA